MHRLIQSIHDKPEPKRRRIVLLTSGLVTGFIALVWATALLPSQLKTTQVVAVVDEVSVEEESSQSPYQVFISSIKSAAEYAWSNRSRASAGEILNADENQLEATTSTKSTDPEPTAKTEKPEFLPISKLQFLP